LVAEAILAKLEQADIRKHMEETVAYGVVEFR
jgi:hypothetical protein